jgi:hypothetical protein
VGHYFFPDFTIFGLDIVRDGSKGVRLAGFYMATGNWHLPVGNEQPTSRTQINLPFPFYRSPFNPTLMPAKLTIPLLLCLVFRVLPLNAQQQGVHPQSSQYEPPTDLWSNRNSTSGATKNSG